MAGRSCRGTTGGATAARPPSGAGTEAGGFECNHPSRLAQFDAQLMMVAHDHDVPSTAGPRLQAGRDRFDQIHDRIAHHYPIVFTQVSHIDRPRFVPRPSDQLLNFGCVGHGGSPCLLALILCCHRSSLSSPFPPSRNARERKSRCCSDPTGCERRVPLGRPRPFGWRRTRSVSLSRPRSAVAVRKERSCRTNYFSPRTSSKT